MQAIAEQAERFVHTDFTVVAYELYVELAERLGALVPISGETRAAFFNAGTEAVENAVKLARLYTGRHAVIAFDGAFHGRTLLSLTMTSRTHPYKTGLGPFAPEVYRAPYPSAYRGPDAETALATLERMFSTHVAAQDVAAIVFEPELGEGGFVPAPPAFVEGLRRICDEHGIVLVADEVQTGFGRTGADVRDGALRRRAGSGHGREVDRRRPAAVGSDRACRDHGSRASRARSAGRSSATRSRWRRPERFSTSSRRRSWSRARRSSATSLRARMLEWQARWPQIGDVRGLGAMLAIELVLDPVDEDACAGLTADVIEAALQRGLLLLKAGVHGNCIRVLCPLTISDAELDEGLDAWEEALAAVLGS